MNVIVWLEFELTYYHVVVQHISNYVEETLSSLIRFYRTIGLMSWVFANSLGDRCSIPCRVIPRLKKWYLIPSCLALSIIRYGSRVKWTNPGKGVATSPATRCSSYRKGSLRVTLDYGRQLYLLTYHFTKPLCSAELFFSETDCPYRRLESLF